MIAAILEKQIYEKWEDRDQIPWTYLELLGQIHIDMLEGQEDFSPDNLMMRKILEV